MRFGSAEYRVDTLVPGAPLRSHVEAIERPRAADAELLVATTACEAAQDIDCPDA